MKEKVLGVLKPLLANRGFNKEELEGLATIVSQNLTEASTEEDINNAVSGVVPYADLMQKVSNRMVTSVENKYKGWVDPTKVEPPKVEKPKNEPTVAPSLEDIQQMISEQVQAGIAAGLKPYQEREERSRLQNLLYGNEKVKGIPEVFRSKYTLDKEENLDALATQIESDYTALKQSLVTSGEFVAPPKGGNAAGETDDLIDFLQNGMHK